MAVSTAVPVGAGAVVADLTHFDWPPRQAA